MNQLTAVNLISVSGQQGYAEIDKEIYSKYQSQIRKKIEEICNDEKKLKQLHNVLAALIECSEYAQERMSTHSSYVAMSNSERTYFDSVFQSLLDKAKHNPKEFLLEYFVKSMNRVCVAAKVKKKISFSLEEFQIIYLEGLSELGFDFRFLNIMGRQIAEEHGVNIKGLLISYKQKNKIR